MVEGWYCLNCKTNVKIQRDQLNQVFCSKCGLKIMGWANKEV